MSFADDVAQEFAEGDDVSVIIGTFVQMVGVQAQVDVGTARVVVPTLGQYPPVPGDAVRLLRVGKLMFLLGAAAPRSPIGRVTATGSPRCTVEYPSGSGISKQMGYPSNITPAVNDIVLIDWTSGGTIIDKITIAPGVLTPVAPGGGGGGTQTQVFTAVDSGTFRTGGWFTSEVWAVTTGNNRGAWFYGPKIADTIPDSAVILAAEIYLPLFFQGGGDPSVQLHTSLAKPGGNVTLTGSPFSLIPRNGWVSIPVALLNYLKANYGGLALEGGGYAKYRGVNADGQSGALRVTYST